VGWKKALTCIDKFIYGSFGFLLARLQFPCVGQFFSVLPYQRRGMNCSNFDQILRQ